MILALTAALLGGLALTPEGTLTGLTGRLWGSGQGASVRSTPRMARDVERLSPERPRRPQAPASER